MAELDQPVAGAAPPAIHAASLLWAAGNGRPPCGGKLRGVRGMTTNRFTRAEARSCPSRLNHNPIRQQPGLGTK